MSEAKKVVASAYKEYKLNGGTLSWNEFQKRYREEIQQWN